jgi:hypothetical protein
VFLPAAEPVPASKIEDITQTDRLGSLAQLAREDATPAPTPIAPPAPVQPQAAAVATSGDRVDTIAPEDSVVEPLPQAPSGDGQPGVG